MPAQTQASEMLGQFINGRFIPRMRGGEDNPPAGDPPNGDDPPTGRDGKPFDADRAQRLIDQQRDEIKTLKTAQRELDAAKTRLQEIDDASKSETERLASKATVAEQKLAAAEQRANDLTLRLTVERAATRAGFHDPDIAYRLLDRTAVELDEAGEPANVEKLLTALAKASPYLVKAEEGEQKRPGTQAVPATPKPAGQATRTQQVDEVYRKMQEAGGMSRW